MSEPVGWKIYDLGLGKRSPHQDRYFYAGVKRTFEHWTPDHRYDREVARQIWLWKNEWEDQREWFTLWGP